MRGLPVKPFIVFHLAVGTRLALRKLAPILAIAFAAYYLLGPQLINAIFAGLLERGSLLMGAVSASLTLSVAAMAAPRICLGLNGWIRHLPARRLTHRRLAGIAVTVAQMPVLFILVLLALISLASFQVSPLLYLIGLPVLGLAAGLCVLPVGHNLLTKSLSLSACVLSASGHWIFLISAVVLLVVADRIAGPLARSRISPFSRRSLSSSLSRALIVLRALRLRILFSYLPSLVILGLTSLFLANNTLTLHQINRAVVFGGILSVAIFFAFFANALSARRPPWPWARSLPWSAKQRFIADSFLIGFGAIPLLILVAFLKIQAIWPAAFCVPPFAFFASLAMRRAIDYASGTLWQILTVETTASVLVCLAPPISVVFLAMTPLILRCGADLEKRQKVSRWLDIHHLAAGDSLSWSRQ
ncbi:MAG: hypothetical protein PVH84_12400 [Candidatus Aminicenantes bacterium]|jgi:hypothetical protein